MLGNGSGLATKHEAEAEVEIVMPQYTDTGPDGWDAMFTPSLSDESYESFEKIHFHANSSRRLGCEIDELHGVKIVNNGGEASNVERVSYRLAWTMGWTLMLQIIPTQCLSDKLAALNSANDLRHQIEG